MTHTPVALVTGANKGIGLETARQLGAKGIAVLVAARSPERGEKAAAELTADGLDARFVRLDVTDEASIQAAAASLDRLDILVNNAGIAPADTATLPSATPVAGLRRAYETNVFGVVAVTNALLPLLRRSPAGRIVNVSSELGSLALLSDPESPFFPFNLLAYNSSKTALNGITLAYSKELADTPIKVNAANPGYCATDLNAHTGPRTAAQGAAEVVHLATLPADGPTGTFTGVHEDRPAARLPW